MSLVRNILDTANMPTRRPELNDRLESNLPGLYIAGDLAGAPVVKLAMEQGYRVARDILAREPGDVVVIGAGAAGLNAALELQAAGRGVIVLDKGTLGNTIRELPEGKWIYTEPQEHTPPGRLSLRECTKDELVELWREDVRRAGLDVREGEAVTSLKREGDGFLVRTNRGEHRVRWIVLAIGKHGTPRKLGVPGEESAKVAHRLYNPNHYHGERVVVIGGGNSAAEAAVALADRNRVTLVHRGSDFGRITKTNRTRLQASSVEIRLNTQVKAFHPAVCELAGGGTLEYDRVFVLAGSEPPTELLRSLGIRLENEWTWRRWAALALSFLIAYTIYGVKQSPGHEYWPYTGWGAQAFTFFHRPWSFWYTVAYTLVVTVFGLRAMKRWGYDRPDRFQRWRYASLIGFQWVFFFLVPEFLFQYAVRFQWVGPQLAADPNFAQNAWRSYGLVYAWPLFFYTFFGKPADIWIIWGLVLSFIIIPVLVLTHGKRYCSWICGCGGLAETLGDRWRHLAPKGDRSIRWERMNAGVLAAAVVITFMVLGQDAYTMLRKPAGVSLEWYHILADTWLVGIIPVTLYPFFGGKVWCRYWCPLAKMMEIFSSAFTRTRVSRFAIASSGKCIACEECSRNCQVGIDVMRYALRQQDITNANSSCIGCGICVTVCPMSVLSFARPQGPLVQIQPAAAAVGQ